MLKDYIIIYNVYEMTIKRTLLLSRDLFDYSSNEIIIID